MHSEAQTLSPEAPLPPPARPATWRVGEYGIHREAFQLTLSGTPVGIEPTPLRLLIYLLEHRDRVVPREELLSAIWPHTRASGASLERAVRAIRRAFGDSRRRGGFVRTVNRVGYQFVGDCVGEPPRERQREEPPAPVFRPTAG
ncbi:MAG: winged helix-turn-helix domain-containing protein [Proteobacteria bacterium]|nr:winged helix-turn-helix domain-containing protein [Pseudomonadota bacterium]